MRIFGIEIKRARPPMTEKAANTSVLFETFLSGLYDCEFRVSKSTFFEIYKRNGDVRACVRKLAERAAYNGLYVEKGGNVLPFEGASAFNIPTFSDFKIRLVRDAKIAGEVYVVPVLDWFGEVAEFKFLDPRSVFKRVDSFGRITWYEQIVAWKKIPLSLEQVSYFRLEPHTSNENDGLSVLEGVIYDTLTDKEAMVRNYKYFVKGMNTDTVFMLDKQIDANQLEVAKEKIRAQVMGNGNAHEPLITNAIDDIKTLSLTNRDIEFIAQRTLTTEKVCAAFDTPKSLIGYTKDVNRANGKEQSLNFIENTVRPFEAFMEHVVNSLWNKYADPAFAEKGFTIKVDGESAEDRTEIEDGQRKDVALGIVSIDEAREERGLKPWGYEETKNPIAGTNVAPLVGRTAAKGA